LQILSFLFSVQETLLFYYEAVRSRNKFQLLYVPWNSLQVDMLGYLKVQYYVTDYFPLNYSTQS